MEDAQHEFALTDLKYTGFSSYSPAEHKLAGLAAVVDKETKFVVANRFLLFWWVLYDS